MKTRVFALSAGLEVLLICGRPSFADTASKAAMAAVDRWMRYR